VFLRGKDAVSKPVAASVAANSNTEEGSNRVLDVRVLRPRGKQKYCIDNRVSSSVVQVLSSQCQVLEY